MSTISRRTALFAGPAFLAGLDASFHDGSHAQTAEPKRGGTLVYAQCSGNRRGGDTSNTRHPYFMVDLITRSAYNALAWVNENLEVVPELAASWQPADETLAVWDVTLREGVRFHNGREMTAADVVSSFELHRRRVGFAQQIQRTEALNARTVRFFLSGGNAEFPFIIAEYDLVIMPANPDLDRIGLEGIGTGPFRIVDADPQRRMTFERNENYWKSGQPYLDRLEVVNREGQMESAINGFRARQFDAVINIDPRLVRQLQSEPETDVVPASSGDQAVIVLPKHPGSPFLDVRIRRALAYAIDREALVRIVYGGARFGWVGNDSHLAGTDPMFVARPVARDVARARQLLAEAGFPNGITLPTLYYAPQWPEMGRYFQVIQETVREAGITLPIEERPNDGYLRFRMGEADVTRGNWHKFAYTAVGPRNPGISLFRMRPDNNESGYWSDQSTERYMALYRQAMVTASAERRKAIYAEMQRIVYDEVPAILPAGRNNVLIKRTNVRGLNNHPQHWSITWDNVWKA
ncbi:MAG: ABC transporter substrate-binding protein [Alphaproteobacteria bacterium]